MCPTEKKSLDIPARLRRIHSGRRVYPPIFLAGLPATLFGGAAQAFSLAYQRPRLPEQQKFAGLNKIPCSALGVSPDGGFQSADLQPVKIHSAGEVCSVKSDFVIVSGPQEFETRPASLHCSNRVRCRIGLSGFLTLPHHRCDGQSSGATGLPLAITSTSMTPPSCYFNSSIFFTSAKPVASSR